MRIRLLFPALALALGACSRPQETPPAPASTAPTAAGGAAGARREHSDRGNGHRDLGAAKPPPGAAPPGAGGKVTWADPPAWRKSPPANAMRAGEYVVPRAGADAEDGECIVSHFGAGQGGTVDANLDRWIRQFEGDGAGNAKRDSREVDGMKVTTLEVSGTFRGMAVPGNPAAAPRSGHRMLGAVVEAPSGLWFVKVTGPDATVQAARPAFEQLLGSLKKVD